MKSENQLSETTGAAPVLLNREAPRHDVQSYDFRSRMLLSPVELRKVRTHQEEAARAVGARLSVHLRSEFSLKLVRVETLTYQKLSEGWRSPSHYSMFKAEPLRGVAVLNVGLQLGSRMLDRLMGGSGQTHASGEELSEIEKVLLEQTVQVLLEEWCRRWSGVKELKPVVLGYENNGSYIQATARESVMLVISLEGTFAGSTGHLQISLPYAAVEPMIKQFCETTSAKESVPAPSPAPVRPCKWNDSFNEVCVPVTVELGGMEMTARQIMGLKVGDVLALDARHLQQVNVRVADALKFQGRPGSQSGQWAVELTRVLKS